MRRLAFISALLALVAAASLTAAAQYGQRRWFSGPVDIPIDPPPPFDGRFTFARLKFTTGPGGYYFRGLPAWAHGYVGGGEGRRSERNLAKILNSITNMNPHVDATRVVDVGDPDLFQYPVVYATEPGFMELDDREAHALGDYLKKGGFVIFDDFRGEADWENFRATMQRVLPGEQPVELPLSHPIFHAFFDIPSFDIVRQFYDRGPPVFRGIFEGNDPTKRMMVMINFNTDISNFWEYSALGFMPMEESNEAYKLGVNYLFYAMTH